MWMEVPLHRGDRGRSAVWEKMGESVALAVRAGSARGDGGEEIGEKGTPVVQCDPTCSSSRGGAFVGLATPISRGRKVVSYFCILNCALIETRSEKGCNIQTKGWTRASPFTIVMPLSLCDVSFGVQDKAFPSSPSSQ